MTEITNPDPVLIVAQRIHEGRSLSGFTLAQIAAGTALHEHQAEVRATYLRVLGEDDGAPLPSATAKIRQIIEITARADREGLDLLSLLPPDATREDLDAAGSLMIAKGNGFRRQTDDMREIAEAVRPFFHGKTTLSKAYAEWEVAQRPEETPMSFFDEDTDRRLQAIIGNTFEAKRLERGTAEAERIVIASMDKVTGSDPVLRRHLLHIGMKARVRAYAGICINEDECHELCLADLKAKRSMPEPPPRIRATLDLVHEQLSGEKLWDAELDEDEDEGEPELAVADLVAAADFALSLNIGPKSRALWTKMRDKGAE
jgi:hypothetical protein